MFQSTVDNRLKEAAQTWFRRLLKMRRTSEGVAGFFALHPGADGEAQLASERGLLEGAAGVGLALLAGATAVEPEWDRMMLVSIGPKLES
jgi:lantibiotic biosynthesis protein